MTFFNIFSSAKKQNRKTIKIIIDYREKNSLVASHLARHGFELEFQQLPIADYLVNDIAIERKTISDFKSSIINKRLISQLESLKQHQKYLLIIEGISLDMYEGVIHENAFRGFLLSIALNYQVPIIYTHDSEDTAIYLSLLAKKSPKKDFPLRASRIMPTMEKRQQFILEGFPGIGPATAKKLLEHFKSLKNIFNAKEEDLQKILGKKSETFTSILQSIPKSQ